MTDDSTQATLIGEPETTLVNMKRTKRGVTKIDRSTQFGNPFLMEKDGGEYTREGCVEAYREWFYEKIESDPDFREDVEALRGETLGCWCRPEACHGDVILEYLRESAE